jgi:hypothetical protein
MRKLKFRAWDKQKKQMINDITHPIWANSFPNEIDVMQFIGLVDKNGKEIYEGDIIQNQNSEVNYEVKQSDKFQTGFDPFTGESECCGCSPKVWVEDCKIIGNIYENPELLRNEDAQNN